MSRDLASDAPRHTRINGIATAPEVSIATKTELCKNPVLLKHNSFCRGEMIATMTEARTPYKGGFIICRTRLIILNGVQLRLFNGSSVD